MSLGGKELIVEFKRSKDTHETRNFTVYIYFFVKHSRTKFLEIPTNHVTAIQGYKRSHAQTEEGGVHICLSV
jgi:hypothetical protein